MTTSLNRCYQLLLVFFVILLALASGAVPVNSIPMKIVNEAGAPIELYWVNVYEKPNKLVKQTTKPIRNSSDTTVRQCLNYWILY
jgi:hypothetical protein